MDSGRLHGLVGGARAGERGPFDAVDPDNALGLYFDDVDGHSASPSASPPPLAFQHAIPISDLELADAWDRFRDPVGELDSPSGAAPPLSDDATLPPLLFDDLFTFDLDDQHAPNQSAAQALLSPLLFPRHLPGSVHTDVGSSDDLRGICTVVPSPSSAQDPPTPALQEFAPPTVACSDSRPLICSNSCDSRCIRLNEWHLHITSCGAMNTFGGWRCECPCGCQFATQKWLEDHLTRCPFSDEDPGLRLDYWGEEDTEWVGEVGGSRR